MSSRVWIGMVLAAAACSRSDVADRSAAGSNDSVTRAVVASTSAQVASQPPDSAVGRMADVTTKGKEHASRAGARRTVLFVGTSLTAGYGLDPDDAYPSLLQRKADSAGFHVEMINAGLSGETSAGALRRIDWLLREPADVIVLETGANDGLRALNVDSTRANLEAIIAKIRAARPAARILLVQMEAPPNLGRDYTAAFRAVYPAVARSTQVALVPFLLAGVAGKAEYNQADGIHPNVAGERLVAENVWPALARVLDELDHGRASG
jgi:acyl-CoA thioesterase I